MNPQENERIPMQFILISAIQDLDLKHNKKYSGAYINCWIKDQSRQNAVHIAKGWIEDTGWIVEDIEEHYPITADDYVDKPESLQYYEQAMTDDKVFVFHIFPQE